MTKSESRKKKWKNKKEHVVVASTFKLTRNNSLTDREDQPTIQTNRKRILKNQHLTEDIGNKMNTMKSCLLLILSVMTGKRITTTRLLILQIRLAVVLANPCQHIPSSSLGNHSCCISTVQNDTQPTVHVVVLHLYFIIAPHQQPTKYKTQLYYIFT